ncbi:MAG: 1-deoxy-D-xylulose-5-phosphate synthase [Phycisphaerae bacterium]|nr:1-deoxy-D-xylulose-5-phosphate synthase [Phycisphaerae bacterium]
MTKLLESIGCPTDFKRLPVNQLVSLAKEIRLRIIDVVGRNGGHLASNLGVVELTLALHYVFDFANDRLLWDVGHQCYTHKLLTGRQEGFERLRKRRGVSGFPNIHESEYDQFTVGHAGTAIATAMGLAMGEAVRKTDRRVVALVGDASIVNGLSFEGMNMAGGLNRQLLVVLNDNSMSIAPTQGAMAEYLAKFRTSELYEEVKRKVGRVLPRLPVVGQGMFDALDAIKEGFKATVSPHQIFDALGFVYVGPTDGHDIPHLIDLLATLKDVQRPVLLHVHTEKGRGCTYATADPTRFHSTKPFKVEGDHVSIASSGGKSFTRAFSDAICALAEDNPRLFAVTAAMPDGTGLVEFAKRFPDRFLDCGIAESGAVAMAGGLAKAGLTPIVAIYSTFLQRSYDQIAQEVSLQQLPVVFCLDRAGLVGSDGSVHHGSYDIGFLRSLPNMVLMAPADEPEMLEALRLAVSLEQATAIRYPRDVVPDPLAETTPPFVLGRSRRLRDGNDATLIAYGSTVATALDAAEQLAGSGIQVGVVNARFAKPLDRQMLTSVLNQGHPVLTVEDHMREGGFGSAVLETAQEMGLPTAQLTRLGLPQDRFIEHGSRAEQLAETGLNLAGLVAAVRGALGTRAEDIEQAGRIAAQTAKNPRGSAQPKAQT